MGLIPGALRSRRLWNFSGIIRIWVGKFGYFCRWWTVKRLAVLLLLFTLLALPIPALARLGLPDIAPLIYSPGVWLLNRTRRSGFQPDSGAAGLL